MAPFAPLGRASAGKWRAGSSTACPGRGLNIAHEALDRHAAGPRADHPVAALHQRHDRQAEGAVHVHEAVVAHHITGKPALDLHPDEVLWCTADPGWVTGTSYGIISPLTNGITMVVDETEFDPERWHRILADHRVTMWYTAPTAVRRLMRLDAG